MAALDGLDLEQVRAEYAALARHHQDTEKDLQAYAHKVLAIRALHVKRMLDGDGFTNVWCRECRVNWPCPTIEVIGE